MIFSWKRILFLCFLNITTSHLMIHLKCAIVHYTNLNSSSKKKSHLRATEHAISFIQFLIYVYFNEAFAKNFMKKLSFFNTNFQNWFQDVLYYRILVCQTLWYENGDPLSTKQNLKKDLFSLGPSRYFDIFFKRQYKQSFEDLQI